MTTPKLVLVTIIAIGGNHIAYAADVCSAQIPTSLKNVVSTQFPEYRTPLVTDNTPEDVAAGKKIGGNGCLGVGLADFDGDGVKDLVLGLVSKTSKAGLIIVAFARGKSWQLDKLRDWDDRESLYVEVGGPGEYERAESLDG